MVGVASHTSTRVACASVAGSQPPSDSGMSSCGGDVCIPARTRLLRKWPFITKVCFRLPMQYTLRRACGAPPRVQSAERGEPFQVGGEGSGFASKRKQSAWIN